MQEVCSIWRRRLESSWRCVPWRQRNSCSSPAWTGLSRWEIIGELIHHPTSYKILTAADREPRARPLPQGWHEGHKPRSSSVLSLKRTPRYSSRSTTPRRLWKLCLEGRDLTIRIAQAPTSTLADGRLGKTVVSGSTVRCDLSYNGRRDHRDGHNCIGSLGCGGGLDCGGFDCGGGFSHFFGRGGSLGCVKHTPHQRSRGGGFDRGRVAS